MFEKEIAAGVDLLDENVPGWEDSISLEILDMGSFTCCVLGQVYGSYNTGLRKLMIYGLPYGFIAHDNIQLTKEWTACIRLKQG